MTDTWAVVIAALGASILTAGATLGLELRRERWSTKRADADRLREACVQLNSHALLFIFPVYAQQLSAVYRRGLKEALDVILYHRKPADPMELMDRLLVEQRPMLEAQATIEVLGKQELIRGTMLVIRAANEVLHKVTKAQDTLDKEASASPLIQRATKLLRGAQTRLLGEMETALREGVRLLGQEVRRFASLTRQHLGVNDPDAVVRAYPELFDEPGSDTGALPEQAFATE